MTTVNEPPISPLQSALVELLAVAQNHPPLRDVLVRLGEALAAVGRAVIPPPEPVVPPAPPPPPAVRPAFVPAPVSVERIAPREVPVGAITPVPGVGPAAEPAGAEAVVDLSAVARRLGIKADVCDRLASTDPAAAAAHQAKFAAAGGGDLWVAHLGETAADAAAVATLAACFHNAESAARLAAAVAERSPAAVSLSTALHLLAEATSALNVAVRAVHDAADADQDLAFGWLRRQTQDHRIYVGQYMTLSKPADPARHADLRGRLDAAARSLEAERGRAAGLKAVAYHVKKLAAADAGSTEADVQAKQVVEKVARQVTDGLPPTNVDLRQLLAPVLDRLPAEAARPEFERVRRAIEEHLAAAETEDVADPPTEAETATVSAVRCAVAGRAMVVIGGQARGESAESLRRALALGRVDWLESRPHESHYHFEAAIRRADVAVVLLLIRFSSHSYAEVQAFCDAAGVPLVRVPGGYGVNQVAHQIAEQAGGKLGVAGGGAADRE